MSSHSWTSGTRRTRASWAEWPPGSVPIHRWAGSPFWSSEAFALSSVLPLEVLALAFAFAKVALAPVALAFPSLALAPGTFGEHHGVEQLAVLGPKSGFVLEDVELDKTSRNEFPKAVNQICLADKNASLSNAGLGVFYRLSRLDPPVLPLPLQDLPKHLALIDALARQVGACRAALPALATLLIILSRGVVLWSSSLLGIQCFSSWMRRLFMDRVDARA